MGRSPSGMDRSRPAATPPSSDATPPGGDATPPASDATPDKSTQPDNTTSPSTPR